jgi:hypothetical protein
MDSGSLVKVLSPADTLRNHTKYPVAFAPGVPDRTACRLPFVTVRPVAAPGAGPVGLSWTTAELAPAM